MQKEFIATIEKQGKWWVGWVEDVPGTNSQGRTIREVEENLKEAVTMVLEARQALKVEEPLRRYRRRIQVNL